MKMSKKIDAAPLPVQASPDRGQVLPRWLVMLLLLGGSGAAQALCVPALCSCTTVTTSMSFGNYSPLAYGNTDSTASLQVSCGGVAGLLIPFKVDLSPGSSGSYSGRTLKNGANSLNYNLYTDASYTTVWGDGSGASQSAQYSLLLDVLGLVPPLQLWVYGRIPGRQLTAVPGVYADTINVTLTYY